MQTVPSNDADANAGVLPQGENATERTVLVCKSDNVAARTHLVPAFWLSSSALLISSFCWCLHIRMQQSGAPWHDAISLPSLDQEHCQAGAPPICFGSRTATQLSLFWTSPTELCSLSMLVLCVIYSKIVFQRISNKSKSARVQREGWRREGTNKTLAYT